MTKNLDAAMQLGGGCEHRPKDWSTERRARQAVLIRGWQPWRRSTGPKTEAGKARSAMNSLEHGFRGCAYLDDARRVRSAIRLAARTNEIARLLIRMRAAHPELKPTYAMLMTAAVDRLRQFRETAGAEKIANRTDRLLEARIVQRGQSSTRDPRNARMGMAALAPQAMVASKEALSFEAQRA